jgi:hypothetical protein
MIVDAVIVKTTKGNLACELVDHFDKTEIEWMFVAHDALEIGLKSLAQVTSIDEHIGFAHRHCECSLQKTRRLASLSRFNWYVKSAASNRDKAGAVQVRRASASIRPRNRFQGAQVARASGNSQSGSNSRQ